MDDWRKRRLLSAVDGASSWLGGLDGGHVRDDGRQICYVE